MGLFSRSVYWLQYHRHTNGLCLSDQSRLYRCRTSSSHAFTDEVHAQQTQNYQLPYSIPLGMRHLNIVLSAGGLPRFPFTYDCLFCVVAVFVSSPACYHRVLPYFIVQNKTDLQKLV